MDSEDKAMIIMVIILCFTFVIAPLAFAAICVLNGY